MRDYYEGLSARQREAAYEAYLDGIMSLEVYNIWAKKTKDGDEIWLLDADNEKYAVEEFDKAVESGNYEHIELQKSTYSNDYLYMMWDGEKHVYEEMVDLGETNFPWSDYLDDWR